MILPSVSIAIATYNHEPFIAQCLDSILAQKTTFPFKLHLGEDCSNDKTREICKKYKKTYPDLIELLLTEKNDFRTNSSNIWNSCLRSGAKYIAMCDGDDYWTDNYKLQKQVEFLEENPQYSISFHAVYESIGADIKLPAFQATQNLTITIEDLAMGNIIHTVSTVFRNGLFSDLPKWFFEVSAGDYVIHMLNARKGLIKYFPDPMAVYRRHSTSIWSSLNEAETLRRWLNVLDMLSTEQFDQNVLQLLKQQKREITNRYLNRLITYNFPKFLEELRKYIYDEPEIIKDWLFEHYPQYIHSLTNSGTYKLSRKLSKIKARLNPPRK